MRVDAIPSGTAGQKAGGAPRRRLDYLDGWRAIAVALVILSHVTGFRAEPLFLKALARWLPMGQVGVLIFFFISGFVISRSALLEIEANSGFSIKAFYIRRVFRIMPPLALYLAVCLGLGALGIVSFGVGNALPAFLYVCNIAPLSQCAWLGGHTWSLAFEEQFYLLFPVLLTVFVLRRAPFLPHLVAALAFCAMPLLFPLSYIGWLGFTLVYGLFIAGLLAARFEAVIFRVVSRWALPGFVMATALVLLAPVTLPWATLANTYPLSFIVTIPAMVLCSGAAGGAVTRALSNGPLCYVGRISYSIYLWQELAASELFRGQNLAVELAAIAAVVALCAVLFEAMERPLIRLGGRLSRRVPDAPPRRTAEAS
jgi:peptidoglycan/LPS O-acetylase OafA/YrhL